MRRRDFENEEEWRCSCGRLLGRQLLSGKIHLRFALGHEYIVSAPVTGVCPKCRTLNELSPGELSPGDKEKKMPGS